MLHWVRNSSREISWFCAVSKIKVLRHFSALCMSLAKFWAFSASHSYEKAVLIKVGFHFGEFGRSTNRWAIRACAARKQSWRQAFTGERAASSGSWIKFNFFATKMSDSELDRIFSMLEHAIVPVRATKFVEVETGLKKCEGYKHKGH